MKRTLANLFVCACVAIGAPCMAQAQPIRTGLDATFAPHAMPKLSG